MKSVVVEASTVAKAIETAWLKAEKPEEFFIRILQEHSSGFLGFGAQKAKIVLFFKNTHKSDSLFPVVVKQKEYSSFFGNFNLKVPAEMNVVDNELNKNVSLGGQHKKKPHNNNQNNQQKPKHSNQPSDVRPRPNNNSSYVKPVPHPVLNKIAQERDAIILQRASQGQAVKQIKIQPSFGKVSADAKTAVDATVNKPVQVAPKMQVALQAPVAKAAVDNNLPAHKEDIVKDIAKVLKKVQTQKVVANVSRPSHSTHDKSLVKSEDTLARNGVNSSRLTHKTTPKSATPKFETYADFINSTTGIPVEKESIISQVAAVVSKIPVVQPMHQDSAQTYVEHNKAVENVAAPREDVIAPMASKPVATAAPRVPLKMKRRPLTTENPGVSGITRSLNSSESIKASDYTKASTDELVDVKADDTNTNEKE